jgi:hypothetical protein
MFGGQSHAPAALSTGKSLFPFYKNLGGHQGLSGWVRKMFPPPGFFYIYLFVSCASLFWYWTFNGRLYRNRAAGCGFFQKEKSDGFGREGNRDLGFQRQACKPLDHRSRYGFDPRTLQSIASRYTD